MNYRKNTLVTHYQGMTVGFTKSDLNSKVALLVRHYAVMYII